MNKVMLIGRLTAKPELRYTPSNVPYSRFSLAVNRPFNSQQGERGTDFINIVIWRKQAENVCNFLDKGSLVSVEGRIQTRTYDAQDGTKRYATDVIAENIELLGSRRDNAGQPVNAYVDTTSQIYPDAPSAEVGTDISSEDPFKDFGNEVSLSDDDLPF